MALGDYGAGARGMEARRVGMRGDVHVHHGTSGAGGCPGGGGIGTITEGRCSNGGTASETMGDAALIDLRTLEQMGPAGEAIGHRAVFSVADEWTELHSSERSQIGGSGFSGRR